MEKDKQEKYEESMFELMKSEHQKALDIENMISLINRGVANIEIQIDGLQTGLNACRGDFYASEAKANLIKTLESLQHRHLASSLQYWQSIVDERNK